MKAKLTTIAAIILCLTSVANAESLEEKFDHAQRQQAEFDYQTKWMPAYEMVLKAGMRSQGFPTSGVALRYSKECDLSYVADIQAVCMTENYYLVQLTNMYLNGQSLNSDFAEETFSQHMFCVKMSNAVGTAKQDYQYGSEMQIQREFVRNVQIAIQSTGFNPNEFYIPSDYMSRMAVMPSLGGFAAPIGAKDGLYIESPNSICKIQSGGVNGLQAQCVKLVK